MEYANRTVEYEQIMASLRVGSTPIIVDTYQASGVTSFLRDKVATTCQELFEQKRILLINVQESSRLADLLFGRLIQPELINEFQGYLNSHFGTRSGSVFASLFEGIDYVGPFLANVIQGKSAEPVYTGQYSCAVEEYFIPFFNDFKRNKKFLLIFDHIENLQEDSHDLLTRLLRCNMVQCILIQTNSQSQLYMKLMNYLIRQGIDLSVRIPFGRPEEKLVRELGLLYGHEISISDAQAIIKDTQQNIHSIVYRIAMVGKQKAKPPLTDWEKAVVSVLNILAQPISDTLLMAIVFDCAVYAPNKAVAYQNAVRDLQERGLVSLSNDHWRLAVQSDPHIRDILDSPGDQLVYRNIVLEFLRKKDPRNTYAELRYQLANELSSMRAEDAKPYLRKLVITSNYAVPDELLYAAELNRGNSKDCLLACIKYCRERKYEKALQWINYIPEELITDDIEALQAVLLNRTRQSDDAEIALIKCLKRIGAPARQNLLGAFLIANYIHMDRLGDARAVYDKMKDLYPGGPMHGYLLRNATSAFAEYRNDLYVDALADFIRDGDDFGRLTTLCNQGYALCKAGHYEDGLKKLEEAKTGLITFPSSNLHILYNDLGICYFQLGRYELAHQALILARNLSQNSMPYIFATINLACLEAVMGDAEQALNLLNEIEEDVETQPIDRVRQKYYPNRLLIDYLNGKKALSPLIEQVQAYPDRYYPEQTVKIVTFYRRFIKSSKPPQKNRWRNLYSPCGLVYWYMDPLKLLPQGII